MKFLKNLLPFLCLLIFIIAALANCALLADDEIQIQQNIAGWQKVGDGKTFTKTTLFNHIDGGAEIFLEFGFDKCIVQNFKHDSTEVTLEIYQMSSPTSALGIYLLKCGDETANSLIQARNSANELQTIALKNRYLIFLNHFTVPEYSDTTLATLLNGILEQIPPAGKIPIIDQLPKENLIPNTIFLFRGPYALEPIFTFGTGDIFELNGKIFGIGADYENGEQKYTLLVIPYPTSEQAKRAFQNFRQFHDPYIKLLQQSADEIIFKDFENKYGILELRNRKIMIKIHLSAEPE